MGFLTKEGLQNLTNKLVQGDAIKVASHRGKNVKEVIDNIQRECENVATPNTMTLENRVNEFKIGQGRDVDVSGDVEEGKVEVELKGKTYQNLCCSNVEVSIQYIADYEIKDRANYLEVTRIAENNNGWYYFSNKTLKVSMLKPNTTYTVFFKYESTCNNMPRLQIVQGNALEWLSDPTNSVSLTNNIYRCVIKTSSSFEGKEVGAQVIYFHNSQPKKVGDTVILYKNMLFLEGDYSTIKSEELPQYFEGIQSSFEDGVVDVEVQGKNLANINTDNSKEEAKGNFFIGEVDEGKYSISLKRSNTSINYNLKLFVDGRYENIIGGQYLSKDFVTFTVHKSGILRMNAYTNGVDMSEIMLVKGTFTEATMPTFEPYYKKKISFNIGEPLRSLPNGVCDEINKLGIETRRVGKTVLNSSENWLIDKNIPEKENQITFYANVSNMIELNSVNLLNFINDKFPVTRDTINLDVEGLSGFGKNVRVSIFKNKLSSPNVEGFKTWLQTNPITVYYELAEPIITPIEPMEFDVKPLATMTINSEIAPISTHKVILNRAGQIEQGIELIADLKSRINNLERLYDSNLIATQYKLDNLKLNYELEREED